MNLRCFLILILGGPVLDAQTLPPMDLTIEQAENLAINSAEDLSVEKWKATVEKTKYDLGLRAFLPTISVGYSDNDSIIMDSPDTYDKELYVTFKETVFDGGKTLRDRSMSRLELEQTMRSVEIDRHSKRESVWELYKNLSLAQKKYEVLKKGLEEASAEEKVTEARRTIGEITDLDVLDVQVQVGNLEDQVDEAQLSVDDMMTQLKEQIHVGPNTELRLVDSLDSDYSGFNVTNTPQDFLRTAEMRSLEYAKMLLQKKQIEAQKEAETWSWVPSIELDTTLSASGPSFPLQQPGTNISLSFSFPAPYFPLNLQLGGGTQGDLSRSRTVTSSADILSDLTPVTAGREIIVSETDLSGKIRQWKQSIVDQATDFIEGYRIRRHKLETLRKTFELETRRENLMEARLKLGEIKPGDLISEQSKLLNTSVDLWTAVVDLMIQESRFEKLMGLSEGELREMETGK